MSKKNVIVKSIISLIFMLILGAALILVANLVSASLLLNVLFIILGVIVILLNIPGLVSGIANVNKKGGLVELIMSILGIVLGVLLIFNHGIIVTILVAVYFIAFPIIRMVTSKDWKSVLKSEWVKILLGILLLVFGGFIIAAIDTIFYWGLMICGIVIIVLALVMFAVSLVTTLVGKKR